MGQSKKKDQKRTEITKDTLLKHLEQNMEGCVLVHDKHLKEHKGFIQ